MAPIPRRQIPDGAAHNGDEEKSAARSQTVSLPEAALPVRSKIFAAPPALLSAPSANFRCPGRPMRARCWQRIFRSDQFFRGQHNFAGRLGRSNELQYFWVSAKPFANGPIMPEFIMDRALMAGLSSPPSERHDPQGRYALYLLIPAIWEARVTDFYEGSVAGAKEIDKSRSVCLDLVGHPMSPGATKLPIRTNRVFVEPPANANVGAVIADSVFWKIGARCPVTPQPPQCPVGTGQVEAHA